MSDKPYLLYSFLISGHNLNRSK